MVRFKFSLLQSIETRAYTLEQIISHKVTKPRTSSSYILVVNEYTISPGSKLPMFCQFTFIS